MTMALANMQIVISRLLQPLRITKGPTRWLHGEPHRQRENLLDRLGGHKRACTSQALHACSCQASAEHLQQCAEFLPLRKRGLGVFQPQVVAVQLDQLRGIGVSLIGSTRSRRSRLRFAARLGSPRAWPARSSHSFASLMHRSASCRWSSEVSMPER